MALSGKNLIAGEWSGETENGFVAFNAIENKPMTTTFADATESAQKSEVEGLAIAVKPTEGTKCERCWHHTDDVGTIEEHAELCGRCVSNVDGEGESRHFA